MPFTDYKPFPEIHHCTDPEHNPPNMMVYEPGTYTWKCPSCGETQTFVVRPKPTLCC